MSQSQEEGGVEVTVIPQHHQQWTQGTVDQLYVSLTVLSHELGERGEKGGSLLLMYEYCLPV